MIYYKRRNKYSGIRILPVAIVYRIYFLLRSPIGYYRFLQNAQFIPR